MILLPDKYFSLSIGTSSSQVTKDVSELTETLQLMSNIEFNGIGRGKLISINLFG
jgi:hypothetical protein